MDVFNEYLKGKKFILFTDHKPLEKMGHLHTKTMNRLQAALLEHDFVIQYKKGEIMPADYLSRLPSLRKNDISEVTEGFDPFQADLHDLQKEDKQLQNMNNFRVSGKWLTKHTSINGRNLSGHRSMKSQTSASPSWWTSSTTSSKFWSLYQNTKSSQETNDFWI
jgi:hypothetical protein